MNFYFFIFLFFYFFLGGGGFRVNFGYASIVNAVPRYALVDLQILQLNITWSEIKEYKTGTVYYCTFCPLSLLILIRAESIHCKP